MRRRETGGREAGRCVGDVDQRLVDVYVVFSVLYNRVDSYLTCVSLALMKSSIS